MTKTPPTAAPVNLDGVEIEQWRRLHPLSPLLNAWAGIAALLSILVFSNLETLSNLPWEKIFAGRGIFILVLWAVGVLAVVAIVLGVYSWLAWRCASYAVNSQAVWFRSGILFRTQRHTRLERIQAIDLVRPLVGRIFGLGKISIEVAGGGESSVTFGYLKDSDLEDLRTEILGLAAGLDPEDLAVETGPEQASTFGSALQERLEPRGKKLLAAPSRPIYRVPTGKLVGSLLFSFAFVFSILVFFGGAALLVVIALIDGEGSLPTIITALPMLVVGLTVLMSRFGKEYGFSTALSAEGIKIRRGLLETRAQTIPPRRVHAVAVIQPWLWRLFGWYRVEINQAGYGQQDSAASSRSDILLPVGSREQAVLALWLVIPNLGVEDPERFLQAALDGKGDAEGFIGIPSRSRWFNPLTFRRRAIALTETSLVIRDGRLTRRTSFAPYGRFQSLRLRQGPLQRALRLANLSAEHVPGPVPLTVFNLDEGDAADALQQLSDHSADDRYREPPERWLQRIETVPELENAKERT